MTTKESNDDNHDKHYQENNDNKDCRDNNAIHNKFYTPVNTPPAARE